MVRHVEVVSDLWMAKELIAGVHDVLSSVISDSRFVTAAVAQNEREQAVNKKAFVINSRNYI